MSDNLNYWYEKILVGVQIMMTGDGRLADRLEDAWVSSLIRMQIHDDVPDDLRQQYVSISERMMPHSQTVKNVLATMPKDAQSKLAFDISKLCVDVVEAHVKYRREI